MVVMRFGETPVPIPNTTVKPKTAESTALETVWEGRWPPTSKRKEGTGLETGGGLLDIVLYRYGQEDRGLRDHPISREVLLEIW